MKEIYFKIIDLPEHQILIEKDFDNEEDEGSFLVTITFYVDDVKIKNSYGYSDKDLRDITFNSISIDQVSKLLEKHIEMFKQ